ncbi:MAG: TIGR00366 family protein [Bacteroidetes bacterium]|nr:TIGR00366 family protein [Bacteroidota bacterium]MBU1113943.1 TIGR00366 family protein [Bacteroidota bacterium]MBU1798262.1 TIGR00366 family protein [Bacteroidota bacterium]
MKQIKHWTPNTYFIISSIIIVVALLSWIIPAGEYNRMIIDGKNIVIPESFHYVESNPQSIADILRAPIKGFVEATLIIGFVLFVGGIFGILHKTEAIDSMIKSIAKAHRKSDLIKKMLIPIFMIIFSLAGAVFGMSEEIIPFILIFVPLALALGYDSVIGVAIPFVGAGVGFAGAFLNPFTIGIAQGIADVPLFSGIEYRIIVWFIVTSVAIIYVSIYAKKIKNNPQMSITYKKDLELIKQLNLDEIEDYKGMNFSHKAVVVSFISGLLVLVWGVINLGWFIEEISAVFLTIGIVVAISGKLSIDETTNSFVAGAKDLVGTALIIAFARGILIVSVEGKIIDTILYHMSSAVNNLHPIVASQTMFLVQTFMNFFVPSGSGQAALTMPIMAPLCDLVGVSRQTAVLAYQFGDGFTNMIIPTSAVTMGVLALADIPWQKWAKWILPLEIVLFLIGLLLLIPPFFMNW